MSTAAMTFACVGINYRTAPVAARELFAVPQRCRRDVLKQLCTLPGMGGVVLLSTCNRTEVYFETQNIEIAVQAIPGLLAHEASNFAPCFYRHTGRQALRHLALVAAGLDSMVVGETEIFGQIKDAYGSARECGSVVGHLHRFFQRSFSIAKKVRSSIPLTVGPTSIGAAAVYLAHACLGELSGTSVLLVGAGEVARSTARSLALRGAGSIFVANRSYDRAVELAQSIGGSVIRFSEWMPYLERIDIVIVSTAAPVYVMSAAVVQQACIARCGRPLFLIDLSVPRNIDPAAAHLSGVVLYDIDDMQGLAEQSMQRREEAVQQGRQLIDAWLNEQDELFGNPAPSCKAE